MDIRLVRLRQKLRHLVATPVVLAGRDIWGQRHDGVWVRNAMTTITWRQQSKRRGLSTIAVLALSATAVAAGLPAVHGAVSRSDIGVPAVSLLGGKWGGKSADNAGLGGGQVNRPDTDPGSLYTITRALGARQLWARSATSGRRLTGTGVTVALLDSGVSAVPGLNGTGKVTYGPDFTLDAVPTVGDSFGHGTFMAGLIAASDPAVDPNGKPVTVDKAAPTVQAGLAPGAGLLSVKLAGPDGSTSVDAVIAALSWVVAHKNDQGMNVRVVNLSFGATALQSYQVDPLAAAVEAAWKAGIVVVASAGNDGVNSGGVVDPALDPFVIAVGASDSQASVAGWDHPIVADFSSRGTTSRQADVLAPGTSVVSLRDPGSTIDAQNPQGLVAGDLSGRLFRGSGTSEAAAVVSGSVALLLQAHPELTPDQVKALLVGTANPVKGASVLDAGAGQIDLQAALATADKLSGSKAAASVNVTQSFPASTGLDGVATADLSGSWNGARWNGARWNGARWNGARWNGARWNGANWS